MTRQPLASEAGKNLWAVILAGEDGTGLFSPPPGTRSDDRRPISTPIDGSLLRQTLERARLAVPWKQIVVVSNDDSHEVHLAPEFPMRRAPRLRIRARGPGSAMDVLLAVHWIWREQTDAVIAILPSEQVVLEPLAFMRHVAAMAGFVTRHEREIVIVGARPTYPETRYGWIETAQPIPDSGSEPVFRVAGLRHGLRYPLARACYESGALWNTSVIVAQAETLLRASRRRSPELDARLQTASALVGTPYEQRTLEDCYAVAREMSFSETVLAGNPGMLAASQLPPVHWSSGTIAHRTPQPPAPRGRFDGLVEQYSLRANVEACRTEAIATDLPWRAKPFEGSSPHRSRGRASKGAPLGRVRPAAGKETLLTGLASSRPGVSLTGARSSKRAKRGSSSLARAAAKNVSRNAETRIPTERRIDQALADSFAASAPPSWTLGIRRAAPEGGG